MKILSLDQSSKLSGWAYFVDGKYVDSGVIDKHKIDNTDERIGVMGLAICSKIKELMPDCVIAEDIQNQSNVKAVISLARLQGCLVLYCASKGIELKFFHPTQWRKALDYRQGSKVKRAELKQQSADYVKEHFGFDNFSEDRNEAICIGVAAHKILND